MEAVASPEVDHHEEAEGSAVGGAAAHDGEAFHEAFGHVLLSLFPLRAHLFFPFTRLLARGLQLPFLSESTEDGAIPAADRPVPPVVCTTLLSKQAMYREPSPLTPSVLSSRMDDPSVMSFRG